MTDPLPETAKKISVSPFCAELRTKKLVFLGHPPRNEEELLDASQHCWCARTQQALGPDGEIVDPDDCRLGRGCFRPYIGA